MILEQLVLEPDVIIIGVEFSLNVIIGFLKQNRNGLRLKRYLEPTQTRWRFFAKKVNGYQLLTIFAKKFNRRCSKYAFENPDKKIAHRHYEFVWQHLVWVPANGVGCQGISTNQTLRFLALNQE